MVSCDSPRGNTLIQPLSPNQGVIQSDSYTTPYTIMPPNSGRSVTPSARDNFSGPIEPLNRLDRLDRLDRMDRSTMNDSLLPLLLGE